MKKVFAIITVLFVCLILTGCGNVSLNLEEVSENLDNLTGENFDLLTAIENIESKYYSTEELYNVYDYDLESLGIDKDNIENLAFRVDVNNNPVYIMVKPLDGKKQAVKKEFDAYLEAFDNKLEAEHEGHLIYIFSDESDKILEEIKGSKRPIFGMLINVEDTEIEALTGVKLDDVEEFLVKNSVMTQASSYYIVKPKSGKTDDVKKSLDEYMTRLEQQWEMYLPDQYELVKNRLEEEYGDYLIYIISTDNELVLKTIKNSKK